MCVLAQNSQSRPFEEPRSFCSMELPQGQCLYVYTCTRNTSLVDNQGANKKTKNHLKSLESVVHPSSVTMVYWDRDKREIGVVYPLLHRLVEIPNRNFSVFELKLETNILEPGRVVN